MEKPIELTEAQDVYAWVSHDPSRLAMELRQEYFGLQYVGVIGEL